MMSGKHSLAICVGKAEKSFPQFIWIQFPVFKNSWPSQLNTCTNSSPEKIHGPKSQVFKHLLISTSICSHGESLSCLLLNCHSPLPSPTLTSFFQAVNAWFLHCRAQYRYLQTFLFPLPSPAWRLLIQSKLMSSRTIQQKAD